MLQPHTLTLILLLNLVFVQSFDQQLSSFKNIILFGDSYSATGYLGIKSSFKDQPGAEETTSSSSIWAQHFRDSCSPTTLLFDFARAGATTDRTLVDSNSFSLEEQINQFNIYSREIGWEARNSLFILFMGINDIGFPILRNQPSDPTLQSNVLSSYTRLAAHLFSQAGARNFLIVSIPPLHRSPIIKSLGSKSVERFKVEASSYNARLVEIAHALGNSDGASVFYYDTTDLFQRIFDAPTQYGFKDSTNYCKPYSRSKDTGLFLEECKYPMSEYFWWDSYHPGAKAHELLAEDMIQKITAAHYQYHASNPARKRRLPSDYEIEMNAL